MLHQEEFAKQTSETEQHFNRTNYIQYRERRQLFEWGKPYTTKQHKKPAVQQDHHTQQTTGTEKKHFNRTNYIHNKTVKKTNISMKRTVHISEAEKHFNRTNYTQQTCKTDQHLKGTNCIQQNRGTNIPTEPTIYIRKTDKTFNKNTIHISVEKMQKQEACILYTSTNGRKD